MYRIVLRDKYKKNKSEDPHKGSEIIDIEDIGDFDIRNMASHGVNRNLQRDIPLFYDGLKTVHRRLLYTMALMKMWPNKPREKCVAVIGETSKTLHPHGDCYESLIFMRQPWRHFTPLIQVKGNYGSAKDPKGYAAMRYVECRLSEFAHDCFFSEWDLQSDAVDMRPSFDRRNLEPIYLPAKYPLFLMSWGSGMGYGVATSSPGFLPQDAMNAVITLIDNPDADIVLYPEDPLGCTIMNKSVFKKYVDYDANNTDEDNLKYKVRSTYSVKHDNLIYIHNTPFEVSPATVEERIITLVKTNKLDGIVHIQTTSLKNGGPIPQLGNAGDMADIVIEIKKGYDPHIIMEKLYKLTGLETTFALNCVYVDENKNKKYNLRESILSWISARKKVLKRLYRIELNENLQRVAVLEALLMLYESKSTDKVIKIMKSNKSTDIPEILIKEFKINDFQAKAISNMRLTEFAPDVYEKYKGEYETKTKRISELKEILRHKKNISKIIKEQMRDGISKYSRKRLSKIIEGEKADGDDITYHTICVTDTGYIKKLPEKTDSFGQVAEDSEIIAVERSIPSNYKLIAFTPDGKVFVETISKLPNSQLTGVGYNMRRNTALNSELHSAVVVDPDNSTSSVICVTKKGFIKRSKAKDYAAAASNSIGLKLNSGDSIVSVLQSTKKDDSVVIYTKNGSCILYKIDEINITARATSGFSGIKFETEDDEVVGAKTVKASDTYMITVSTKGDVKKFSYESTLGSMKRGAKGIEVMSRNENIYNLITAGPKDDVIGIYTSKTPDGEFLQLSDIPTKTRISTGVKLLNVRRGREVIRTGKLPTTEEKKK